MADFFLFLFMNMNKYRKERIKRVLIQYEFENKTRLKFKLLKNLRKIKPQALHGYYKNNRNVQTF